MDEKQRRGSHARNCVLIVAFLGAICLPMAGMLLGLAPHLSLSENRRMAAFPKFGWRPTALKGFVYELKPYLRDNFGFRPLLIGCYHLLKGHLLGTSSSPQVLLGKEGWLFYNGEQVLDDYCCVRPFGTQDLESMGRVFEQERDWLARRGIRYLLVVVPNNHTLYPEFLPDWVMRARPESRMDQLLAYMRANSTVAFLDLRPALLKAKQTVRVCCRTDTHWNAYGAFIGCQVIMHELCAWFPAIKPLELEDFTRVTRMQRGGDLARMIGAANERREEAIELLPRTPPRGDPRETRPETRVNGKLLPAIIVSEIPGARNLPRAVMLRDSCAGAMIPYLAEDFSRIAFVATKRFQRKLIESEKPDVVIREFNERFLMQESTKFLDQDAAPQSDDAP